MDCIQKESSDQKSVVKNENSDTKIVYLCDFRKAKKTHDELHDKFERLLDASNRAAEKVRW